MTLEDLGSSASPPYKENHRVWSASRPSHIGSGSICSEVHKQKRRDSCARPPIGRVSISPSTDHRAESASRHCLLSLSEPRDRSEDADCLDKSSRGSDNRWDMLGSRASSLQPAPVVNRSTVLCRGGTQANQHLDSSAAPSCSRSPAALPASLTRRAALLASLLAPAVAHRPQVWAQEVNEVPPLPKPGTNPYGQNVLQMPGEFLRTRQRLNGGAKILAPIRASQRKLKEAETVLGNVNVYDPNPDLYKDALKMVRMASLNCYSFEALEGDSFDTKASLLQRKIGISDGCTFRLIAKNVTGLLPPSKKKLRSDTTLRLEDLIRSYQLLDDRLAGAWAGDPSAMESVAAALQATQAQTSSFETIIERCLDLPPSNVAPSAISSLSVERLRRLWARDPSSGSLS